MRVNFNYYTVVGGNYFKVRHFSKTFDSLSQVAKFLDDNRMPLPDKHGSITAIYLSKCSGLTKREFKILNNKYRAIYERTRHTHGLI